MSMSAKNDFEGAEKSLDELRQRRDTLVNAVYEIEKTLKLMGQHRDRMLLIYASECGIPQSDMLAHHRQPINLSDPLKQGEKK